MAKKSEEQALDAAANVAEKQEGQDNLVTLSQGITLEIRPVPPLLVYEVLNRMEKPKPPMVWNEDRKRDEANPNDPEYLEALEQFILTVGMAQANTMFLMGTKVHSVPEGCFGPEDDGWQELLQDLDTPIPIEEGKSKRYVQWLRLYALATEEDQRKIMAACGRASGVRKEDVEKAVDNFRSDMAGPTDNGSPTEGLDQPSD